MILSYKFKEDVPIFTIFNPSSQTTETMPLEQYCSTFEATAVNLFQSEYKSYTNQQYHKLGNSEYYLLGFKVNHHIGKKAEEGHKAKEITADDEVDFIGSHIKNKMQQ